jgi:ankyrin repeat protein
MSDDFYTQEELNDELHECARHGELDILKEMKADDDTNMLDFNALDAQGNSALHKAAANGHVDMLIFLKEMGTKYSRNLSGKDPLTWAIINKHLATVQYLILTYPEIDILFKPEHGLSPLSTAHDIGEPDIIEALFKHPSASALEAKNLEIDESDDDEDDDEDKDENQADNIVPPTIEESNVE